MLHQKRGQGKEGSKPEVTQALEDINLTSSFASGMVKYMEAELIDFGSRSMGLDG